MAHKKSEASSTCLTASVMPNGCMPCCEFTPGHEATRRIFAPSPTHIQCVCVKRNPNTSWGGWKEGFAMPQFIPAMRTELLLCAPFIANTLSRAHATSQLATSRCSTSVSMPGKYLTGSVVCRSILCRHPRASCRNCIC